MSSSARLGTVDRVVRRLETEAGSNPSGPLQIRRLRHTLADEPGHPRPAVSYRLFGPLTIRVGDAIRRPTQRRERNVLALLIANGGRPISADRLVDQLWAGAPPLRAMACLHVVVSRLRTILEPARTPRTTPRRLITSTGGYALHAGEDTVDLWRFEAGANRAIAAPPLACVLISQDTLAEWQGEPFAGCADTQLVRADAARLTELRTTLIEARARALLGLGHPEIASRELHPLVEDHPFREQLWCLLATSQYQMLRQADALTTVRVLRRRLADDLGIDPSPTVRTLECAILNQSPALDAPPPVPLFDPFPGPMVTSAMAAAG